jgi:hypothetical protein
MVIRKGQSPQPQELKIMFATTFKTAAFIATAVVAAHATLGAVSFNSLQTAADRAVMPIVTAEPIIVTAKAPQIIKAEAIIVHAKPLQVVKAERIEVRAKAV